MAFYLLTYFNDVNVGRNILINSHEQLQEKMKKKTEEDRKNTDESDFSENEIPDLNSLKPFEFETKTNIGDINSNSSDD